MLRPVTARSAILAFTCSLLISAHAVADGTKRSIHIPSGDLAVALELLAKQSGADLVYRPEQVESFRTDGVDGDLSTEEAVTRLLKGTPLTLSVDSTGAMLIALPSQSEAPQALNAAEWSRLRLAQAETSNSSQGGGQGGYEGDARSRERIELEEIVVTGTHIRGGPGAGSKVVTVTREQISQSGYATVQDILKRLPQNFGGGVSEDNATEPGALNLNSGTAINLRGLGSDSTLVLVNGRRQPAGGLSGAFVDVSSIASSAVERIEILADGASALYGSDAVGGVVNFILRNDYDGAETRARVGTLGGDAAETQLSQLIGTAWASGSVLVGYQYYDRDALKRADRSYTATDDLRPFGGSDFRSLQSNPGNILDSAGRPTHGIPQGQDGTSLTSADLLAGTTNFSSRGENGAHLLPQQQIHSAFLNASKEVSEHVRLSLDGRYATRATTAVSSGVGRTLLVPDSNPFFVTPTPGATSVRVAYNFVDDLGPVTLSSTTDTYNGTLAASLDLTQSWVITAAGTFGEERARTRGANFVNDRALSSALSNPDPALSFNPFGDGSNTNPATLQLIRASQYNSSLSRMIAGNIKADGVLFQLPAGLSRLAIGVDVREEELKTFQEFTAVPSTGGSIDRQVSAAFGEVVLPLLPGGLGSNSDHALDVSLAARYEKYSDFGTSFNPKVGLTWRPLDLIDLRATWGTSFRAPRLIDLVDSPRANLSNTAAVIPIRDPQSPTGFSRALVRFGSNSQLDAESATTWSVGVDVYPFESRASGISLSYFDIDYRDRIAAGGPVGNPLGVLLDGDVWSEIINRTPSQAQIDAICQSEQFVFGDCSTPVAVLVDLRLRNLAGVRMRGLDLSADHTVLTRFGSIHADVSGTYTLDFRRQVSRTSPTVDLVDTVGNMPALRLRGALSWTFGGLSASVSGNYIGEYTDRLASRRVDASFTLDAGLSYKLVGGERFYRDMVIGLTAINVLDQDPSFVNAQFFGYDTANADPLGRVVSVNIAKNW